MASTVCSCSVYVSITGVILLSLFAYSHGLYNRPTILDNREVVIESGGNYTALCEGDSPLNWTWSDLNEFDSEGFKVEINDVIPKSKSHASRIFLQNLNFLHTGYITCFSKNVPRPDDYQKDQIYLYVRDPKHLAVTVQEVETILVTQYSDALIPCKPTSPDVKVELTLITGEQIKNTTYDPKTGFRFYVKDITDEGEYFCNFKLGDIEHEVFVYLKVITVTDSLAIPLLEEISGGHTLIGEKLVLECKIRSLTYISFTWTTPTGPYNPDRMTLSTQMKEPGNDEVIFQTLTINNATKYDKGVYRCEVTDNQKHHSDTSIQVNVYDKNEHFISLTEENGVYALSVPAGKSEVQWRIDVRGHPQPELTWLNNNKEIIPEGDSNHYYTNFTSLDTALLIKNIAITDYGNYTLIAKNEFEEKSLVLFLNVTDKPTAKLHIKDFYFVNETSHVKCIAVASPPPTAAVFYKPCMDNSCKYQKLPSLRSRYNNLELTFEASFAPDHSGSVKCLARNSVGDDEVTENYYVTDVKNGLDIFGFEDNVNFDNYEVDIAKGDTLKAKCGGSVNNFTHEIEWLHEGKILKNDERLMLERSNTPYSNRLTLNMQNISFMDGGNYTCRIKTLNGIFKKKEMIVRVLEPSKPVIVKTNMMRDIHMDFPDKVEFYCNISGLPKPRLMWFKNNEPIQPNNRIRIRNNNQNLTFDSTHPQDEGSYKCEASNTLGRVSREINLKFRNNPALWNRWLLLAVGILVLFVVLATIFIVFKIRNEKKLQKELRIAGLANFEKGALENLNPELGIDDQAELLPYDKKWEFPIEKLKLGKQLGSGAFGVVMKGEAKGIVEGESVTTVAVKMVKKNAGHAFIKALASELKIMVHLGKHLNVVNLLGACTKNVAKRELLVIVEFCRYGNLQNYLLRHRDNFIDQVNPKTGHIDYTIGQEALERSYSVSSNRSNTQSPYMKYAALSFSNSSGSQVPHDMVDYRGNDYNVTTAKTEMTVVSMSPNSGDEGMMVSNNSSIQPEWRSNYKGDYKGNVKPICTKDLLAWAFQVSRGMEYLASRRVLHGDLAARNILLADNNVVKICDFGLAKSMYKNDNYKKKGDGPLPVKWMAIESIRDKVFSTQSDVWSFGIVLWEFFSLARTPYPGMEADERLYNKLLDGYRMESPEYAPKEVYKMMLDCWQAKPLNRPSFTKLAERIGSMLEDTVRRHYIDLNDPYLVMNTQRLEEGHSDYLAMLSPPNFENLSSPHHYVNDLPPEEDTPGYLCMKSANIFSPRPLDDRVFDFDVSTKNKREAEGAGHELLPMLGVGNESDCEGPTSPNSFSNPSYHLPPIVNTDTQKSEKDLVKLSDNYVNIPESKNALKDNNPFIKNDKDLKETNYVNSTSRDWESAFAK